MSGEVIAEAIAGLIEPVTKVKLHPRNPRRGDIPAIAASLTRFGQVRPILVQASTSYIVAGNHTYRAAREVLGWKRIAVARIEISDEEAAAYMVTDNRMSDIATNDDLALAEILQGLEDAGRLEGTGYAPGDAEDIRALVAQLPDDPDPGAPAEPDPQRPGRIRGATIDVTLTMPADAKPKFSADLDALRAHWGTKGVTETVLRAVADCIERLPNPAA